MPVREQTVLRQQLFDTLNTNLITEVEWTEWSNHPGGRRTEYAPESFKNLCDALQQTLDHHPHRAIWIGVRWVSKPSVHLNLTTGIRKSASIKTAEKMIQGIDDAKISFLDVILEYFA